MAEKVAIKKIAQDGPTISYFPVHCRECLGEAHEPASCENWRKWSQKIVECKPEESKSKVNYQGATPIAKRRDLLIMFFLPGHDVNFCSDLPRRASEIQFSLALLQLSLALEKLCIIIL